VAALTVLPALTAVAPAIAALTLLAVAVLRPAAAAAVTPMRTMPAA
jgi:hypothetical protein